MGVLGRVNEGITYPTGFVDLVDAKVRAGGNIMIFGKPKKINQKTVAGGNIKEAR